MINMKRGKEIIEKINTKDQLKFQVQVQVIVHVHEGITIITKQKNIIILINTKNQQQEELIRKNITNPLKEKKAIAQNILIRGKSQDLIIQNRVPQEKKVHQMLIIMNGKEGQCLSINIK